ncbi:hypothetical protein SLA2020_034420 [Shorea laevis]
MWRQNKFQGNSDSDQSISDDEDFNLGLRDDCVSFGGGEQRAREKEDGLQLQSRLEILKGITRPSCERKTNNSSLVASKEASSSLEDDVEVPDSPNKGDYHVSSMKTYKHIINEEVISDDEESDELPYFSAAPSAKRSHCSFGREEQDSECRWSLVTKEAEALNHLNKNLSHFSHSSCSKEDQSCRGARPKAKPRFSFGLPHKSWPSVLKDENDALPVDSRKPERLKAIDHETSEQAIDEFPEEFHGYRDEQSEFVPAEEEAPGQGFQEHSMAELLDDLQDNTSLPRWHSKISSRTRGKRALPAFKKHSCSLGDRTIDGEDLPELMVGDSSSNDEADYQILKLVIPEVKKTMADRFQEALGATSLSSELAIAAAPKPLCSGLFGKLQQVVQQEKEKDLHFLKKLQSGAIEEPSCIDVQIMSRYLDAKLTVCHCLFIKATEDIRSPDGAKEMENEGKKMIVIFNQRICGNVDLEIGNSIRIYPQWKEVQVEGNAEKIVLSTYFSQI